MLAHGGTISLATIRVLNGGFQKILTIWRSTVTARRKLKPGETVIGFVRPDGSLIGQFADPAVGHQVLAGRYVGLLPQLNAGQAIAITIGKRTDGTIVVFGSGWFPPPGGIPLSASFKALVAGLVE